MDAIIVFGGAGYVGSHCCKVLHQAGYLPVVFDDLSTGHSEFAKWGPLIEGDIRDSGKVGSALSEYRPVAAMHFAAKSLVGESVAEPGLYYDANVLGTLSLLNALCRHKVKHLVFSSTCAVYGDNSGGSLSEDAPLGPASPYGNTKLACERMIADFQSAHGLNAISLRYFNAAGADPDAEIGEAHHPETHLIPLILDVAAGRREKIGIFGSDYPTPDGTAIRDYVHVMDIARAHVGSMRFLMNGGRTSPINLGTGTGHSVLDVVNTAEKITKAPISRSRLSRRAGDAARLVAEAEKARSLLDWRPDWSDLTLIVEDAWRWHRMRFGAADTVMDSQRPAAIA